MTSRAPISLLAATTAGRSSTTPVDDCTALTATRSIPGRIAATNSSPGTATTSTPRSSCTFHGNTFEVNSTVSVSTVAPSGSAAAIGTKAADTVLPTNTSAASAPTNRANDSRARPVDSSHGSQLVAPTRQSASAACSASQAGRGGNPYDAVFSHPGSGSHSPANSSTVPTPASFSLGSTLRRNLT